jgi:uncharacterized protein YfaS (alpha-2-macroglobulin family)
MSKYMKVKTLFLLAVLMSVNALNAQKMSFSNGTYPKEWKEIEDLDGQGLPKSALEKVEALYLIAKKDDNPSQVIKTSIYRARYISQLEEDGFIKAVGRLQQEAETAVFPTKSILQSMLGELYAGYLENNVWRFRNRTTTANDFKQDDIRTWDIEKLNHESARLYKESVKDDTAKQVAISNFNAITTEGGDTMRPTLYDFLAHRAIDFFMNEKSYLAQPAYKFDLENDNVFSPVETFVTLPFSSKDSSSGKLWTLKLMQNVLKFHLNDAEPTALIDADLKRLDFVNDHAVLDNKTRFYQDALETLQKKYQKHPAYIEISYKIAAIYVNIAQAYKPNPDNIDKNAYKRALEILKNAVNLYPNAYGVKMSRAMIDRITEPSLNVKTEQVNIPLKSILTQISYRNVNIAFFKVVRVNETILKKRFEIDADRLTYFNTLPAVKSWSVKLPNDEDYNPHTTETPTPKLPLGQYILLVSDNEAFQLKNGSKANHTHFYVSNIAFAHRTEEGNNHEFIVMDRVTGAPLKGVTAEFWETRYNSTKNQDETLKIGSSVSDAKGFINPKLEKGHYYTAKFIFGKDTLATQDGFNIYDYYNGGIKNEQFTQFFLDRAIYRPSQTVYFKAILLQKDAKGKPTIIPNRKMKITFYDANNQKVSETELISNEFGTINGNFTAPASGLLGHMHLQSDLNGSHYFRVEEYKRPKFEVKIPALEGNFVINQDVKIKGNAKAFAGSNVDGAKVAYRVTRQVDFPYYKVGWGWNPWAGTSQEITHGEVTTDNQGDFIIPFKAIPNKAILAKDKPVFNYTIIVDVTDISGETHSTSTTVNVGYTAMSLSAEIPEIVNRRTAKPFKINTNNLNGQALASQVNVKIDLLTSPRRPYVSRYWELPDTQTLEKAEFGRQFPAYAYKNEDKIANWVTKKKILDTKLKTIAPLSKNGNLLTIPDIRNWEPGAYRVTLTTTDSSGEKLQVIEHFTLYDEVDKLTPINKSQFVVFEKNTFEPYEDASFVIGTSEEMLMVLFEIERDGKIETQNWLNIKGQEKMTFKIEEADRGNIFVHLTYVKNNRFSHETETVIVPFTNKALNVEYQTFRDKLQPGQDEEWRLKITGQNKDKVAAEMVATMYDASLDQFARNAWDLNLYPSRYARKNFGASTFKDVNSEDFYLNTEGGVDGDENHTYRNLNWFGFNFNEGGRVVMMRSAPMMAGGAAPPAPVSDSAPQAKMADSNSLNEVVVGYATEKSKAVTASVSVVGGLEVLPAKQAVSKQPTDVSSVKVRTNLNETVFFFPTLMTDNEGNIIVKFKMNEALTRWRFLGLAHTKDLKVGMTEKEIVTQKDLMVFPNAPRFFREGDAIEFTTKVSNLSANTLKGAAVLQLYDALTMQPMDVAFENTAFEQTFEAKAGESSLVTWKLKIPTGKAQAVTYRVIARAGNFSDGEENTLPVLTNRMLVTETLPLSIKGGEKKKFEFKALKEANSTTLVHHKLTLEFTQNPAWYAVQALPYLMEYPYDCTEQIFSRYYANSLATDVANAHPKIKTVFDRWKNLDVAALQSNLSKNQELKTALLEETPWVLDAQREEVQKKNIGLLFDLNKMANESQAAIKKMEERQTGNGGFSWFPGGRENWYITQYITEGFGHLNALGVKNLAADDKTMGMVNKAVGYCDQKVIEYYNEIEGYVKQGRIKMEDDHIGSIIAHYLYMRSFFKQPMPNPAIFNYFIGQADKYWTSKSIYEQGLLALALKRYGKDGSTTAIVKSLKERSLNNEELGMYWKNEYGYTWDNLPIETHSLMIELFNEVGDTKAVDDLKIWLLKNKQTNAWKTTKGTASAVYALLKTGQNWLLEDTDVKISMNNTPLEVSKYQKEAGTGYFKTSFEPKEITAQMGDVVVENPNKVVAWGSIYWQYFEDLDKIKTFKETPLKMTKQLFKEEMGDKGAIISPITAKTLLNQGDKVKVRIELRVDRNMEYVHLKDMRASGFEPTNVLSGYKWQGGLGYYESTKDASTNFFIDFLPKGTYVFEYPLVVNLKGDFSNGVTTIQCMYAPEFTSHSEGVRVKIGK